MIVEYTVRDDVDGVDKYMIKDLLVMAQQCTLLRLPCLDAGEFIGNNNFIIEVIFNGAAQELQQHCETIKLACYGIFRQTNLTHFPRNLLTYQIFEE